MALQLCSEVSNITFIRVGTGTGSSAYSNNASILFANYSAGAAAAAAFAYFGEPGQTGSTSIAGDVWVNSTLPENQSFNNLDYGPQVLLHEIGHALGLDHPGDYNANPTLDPTYDVDAVYWQDTRMFTVMSYFGSGNTGGSLPGFASGPQLHDIAAIQRLYGANMNTRAGDTVYGFHSNTGETHFSITSGSQGSVFAIWDAGGTDTLNLSGYTTRCDIDLRPESFSSAGPDGVGGSALYNISIARGVTIENAIGGSGNDTITGNDVNNTLDGGSGADAMAGGLGNDTYVVDHAGDAVAEGANAGIDLVQASVSYSLGANLENLTLTGTALNGGGNSLDNVITGNASNNVLWGGDGNDTLDGGGGADQLDGQAGNDTYIIDNAGDFVWEAANAGTDTVEASISYALQSNFENLTLTGSANIDATGNGLDNVIAGNAGTNTLTGGAGNDTFVFHAGDANGDSALDFAGNGASAGDSLDLEGYGTAAQGATFIQLDATHWQINSADGTIHDVITLANGASIDASDFVFGGG
jgi:serralysin